MSRAFDWRIQVAVGSGLVLMILAAAFVGSWLSPYDPNAVNLAQALRPPDAGHWLGTDDLGRDVLTRVLVAGRVDLQIALICVVLPFVLGSVLGAVAGFAGGRVDAVIMRTTEVLWAFPFYVLVIAIVGILGPGETNMYIAFTLVVWISFARIVRGEVLVARQAEYVLAARVLGYSDSRIVLRHILPNTIMPAVVFAMSDVVLTILAVTALSFLGLGIQPPNPSWGAMLARLSIHGDRAGADVCAGIGHSGRLAGVQRAGRVLAHRARSHHEGSLSFNWTHSCPFIDC